MLVFVVGFFEVRSFCLCVGKRVRNSRPDTYWQPRVVGRRSFAKLRCEINLKSAFRYCAFRSKTSFFFGLVLGAEQLARGKSDSWGSVNRAELSFYNSKCTLKGALEFRHAILERKDWDACGGGCWQVSDLLKFLEDDKEKIDNETSVRASYQ